MYNVRGLCLHLGRLVMCGVCGVCMKHGTCIWCVGACGMYKSVWGRWSVCGCRGCVVGLCISQLVSLEDVVYVCACHLCGLWCVWRFGEPHKSTQLALLSSSLFSVSWAPSSGVKAPLATHEGRNWQTIWKGPDRKYFRFCGPYGLCHNYSFPLL